MKKLNNPYESIDNHCCFGCASDNKYGLQMEFYESDDKIISIWEPKNRFQGFNYVLHGGIQSTLMDEIASWVVFIKLKTAGVTSKLKIKYKKPVYTNRGKIKLTAELVSLKHHIAKIETKLFDADENLCSQGLIYYHTFSKKEAKAKLAYPDYKKFFQ